MDFALIFVLLGLAALFGDSDDGGQTTAGADGSGDDQFDDRTIGTSDGDLITGTAQADTVLGEGGADTLVLNNGDDAALGGSGDDRIFGGAGNDVIGPESGADSVFGGAGDDLVFQTLVDDNNQFLSFVSTGDDFIRGGAGDDALFDGIGADSVYGDAGDDFIGALEVSGDTPNEDRLFGGHGNDTLVGDAGDTMKGGSGADVFENGISNNQGPIFIEDFNSVQGDQLVLYASTGTPSSITQTIQSGGSIWGEPAIEVRLDGELLAIVNTTTPLTISDLSVHDANGNNIASPDMFDALTLNGSSEADILAGTDDSEVILGNFGNDQIFGINGADTIRGGWGDDTVAGGDGNDRIFLDSGDDVVDSTGDGDDFIRGGAGEDTIIDSNGSDTIYGDLDRDFIDVTGNLYDTGNDLVYGGFSADTIVFEAGDTVTGGHGADRFEVEFEAGGPDIAVVTDFNAQGTDTLVIKANSSYSPANVDVRVEPEGVYVSLGGEDLVLLEGLSALPPSQIEYVFEDPPDPWA